MAPVLGIRRLARGRRVLADNDDDSWSGAVMSGVAGRDDRDVAADPQPIHHIGVCLDRSVIADRVMSHAAALAKAFDAKLTVLHALEPPHEGPDVTPTDPLDWEVQRTAAQRHLEAVRTEHDEGLRVGSEILEGRPAEEIRTWVTSHGVDLTVLASHGASGLTEWSLASTARKLVEGIAGSVLLVPAWSADERAVVEVTYQRIMVLLDGSPRSESALPVASKLAVAHGSELQLLHVVPIPERSCPGPLEAEEPDLDRRLVDRNTRAAHLYLTGVGHRVARDGIRVRTQVGVDGDVRTEILRRVADDHADLVVLTAHGQGGRLELPFGGVASFLLEHATVPLLLVRDPTIRLDDGKLRGKPSQVRLRLPESMGS